MDDTDDDLDWLQSPLAPVVMGKLANKVGLIRQRALARLGVEPRHVAESVRARWIKRIRRGLYCGTEISGWRSGPIAQVSALRPRAVLALRDAAMLWGLIPFDDSLAPWFAIGHKDRKPTALPFAVNWLRWSTARLSVGVEEHRFAEVNVRLTTPARTVADYFAHVRRVPGEVMVMLHAYRQSQFWDLTALKVMTKLCGVTERMRTALKELSCSLPADERPACGTAAAPSESFAREVARSQRVWTLRGRSMPQLNGAVPFWSSLDGARQAMASAAAFAGFESFELSWNELRDLWLPALESEGLRVCVDDGAHALRPSEVQAQIEHELSKLSS